MQRILGELDGVPHLIGLLLYGSGMRLLECLTLRIKDVDLERGEVWIRRGKGAKDRVTVLPCAARQPLAEHLERVRALHGRDLAEGGGAVELPDALRRKYPSAPRQWAWQWIFPARRRYVDRETGERRRHHLHERDAACDGGRGARKRDREAGELPHAAALVRDASSGGRLRHQDSAGTPRPPGRDDDDDLHARAEPWRTRRSESGRPTVRECRVAGLRGGA